MYGSIIKTYWMQAVPGKPVYGVGKRKPISDMMQVFMRLIILI